MVYVFESDFSYIIPPFDDNKRLLFMSESAVKTLILKETESKQGL